MPSFDFRTVPHIHVGAGSAARLAVLAAPLIGDRRRVFLVTDPGVRAAGLTDGAVAALEAAGLSVSIFDQVVADPPEAVVLAAADAARTFGAEIVIGFGGGSSMDCSKLVAVLCGSSQSLTAMYGVDNAKGPRLPLILIPTTAGTGSEVTPISVVTVGETTKMGVNSPALYGDLAVLDASKSSTAPLSAPAPMAAIPKRARICCSAPCWPDRPSPMRRSVRCMRWPTRSVACFTCRTACPTH